ncbi:hypothetical protein F4819DRAFT_431448 [Hypoxylon fuscum]|nr:hypothetical protein F4819DRAFT_431448 [Hypoxylon fuscum]
MSQATVNSIQISGDQTQRGGPSEMMRYYLASGPSTTTDRLAQGKVMSDKDIINNTKQKEMQLDALVRQAKGEGPQ